MQPRNVLYVLFDDLRADYGFGSDASSSGHTPNLDKLSQTGVKFELAFSQVAFCVPSRTSFLTGLRPETTTSVHNDQVKRFRDNRLAPLRPGTTVLDAFKRAGYTTAAVGKIFHFGEAHPSLDLPVLTNTHDLLGRPCDRPDATDVRVPKAVARYGFPRACQLPFGSFVDQRAAAGARARGVPDMPRSRIVSSVGSPLCFWRPSSGAPCAACIILEDGVLCVDGHRAPPCVGTRYR